MGLVLPFVTVSEYGRNAFQVPLDLECLYVQQSHYSSFDHVKGDSKESELPLSCSTLTRFRSMDHAALQISMKITNNAA